MARGWLLLALVVTACGSSAAPAAERAATGGEEAPGDGAVCAGVPAEAAHERAVDGAHRACTDDADCESVRLDCSNLRCGAVHREHAAGYAAPPDCSGYAGPVGNYDCMPRFGSERPVCMDGCCVSERLEGRATADEACGAIAEIYAAAGCTVFGPTFSVDQCLADVAEIRAGADDAQLRRLQQGLDCARTVSTCAQIQVCVDQFRGR